MFHNAFFLSSPNYYYYHAEHRTSEGNWFCTDQILSANIYEHFFYNYLLRLLRSSWMTIIITQKKHYNIIKETRVGESKSMK